MGRRQQLHLVLKTCADNVYFQAPATVTMDYPCIVYSRDNADTTFANNVPYQNVKRYQVTVIDRDPDSVIPDKVAALPMTTFGRHFEKDGLNHDVYEMYY